MYLYKRIPEKDVDKNKLQQCREMLAFCVRDLKVPVPEMFFFERYAPSDWPENGLIFFRRENRISGLACPAHGSNGAVFIKSGSAPQMASTVAHECFHLYEARAGVLVDDEFAEKYAKKALFSFKNV